MTLGSPAAFRCAKGSCDVRSVAGHCLPKARTKAHGRPGDVRDGGTWVQKAIGFRQKCLVVVSLCGGPFRWGETLDLGRAPFPLRGPLPPLHGGTTSVGFDDFRLRGRGEFNQRVVTRGAGGFRHISLVVSVRILQFRNVEPRSGEFPGRGKGPTTWEKGEGQVLRFFQFEGFSIR